MLLVVTITLKEGQPQVICRTTDTFSYWEDATWRVEKKPTNSNFAKQKSVEAFIGNTFFDNFPALKLNKFPYLPWNQNLPEIHLVGSAQGTRLSAQGGAKFP